MKTARQNARVLLFAYGTLLESKVQRRVFGREVVIRPARVLDWKVGRKLIAGRFRGLMPREGASTAGGLLQITAKERARADAYEGAPHFYRRIRVTALVGAKRVRCWVYVPTPMSSDR